MIKSIILILVLIFSNSSQAALQCADLFSDSRLASTSSALSRLQSQQKEGLDILANQDHYESYIKPDGGGACATVTWFNFLQVIRAKLNLPLLDPRTTIEKAFDLMPELKDGRVTNDQMEKLITTFKTEFNKTNYNLKVSTSDFKNNLTLNSSETKLITYQVFSGSGRLLGRHFVVLKNGLENDRITVVDPHALTKDYTYEVIPGPGDDLHLVRPGKTSNDGWTFKVDVVFSVDLNP